MALQSQGFRLSALPTGRSVDISGKIDRETERLITGLDNVGKKVAADIQSYKQKQQKLRIGDAVFNAIGGDETAIKELPDDEKLIALIELEKFGEIDRKKKLEEWNEKRDRQIYEDAQWKQQVTELTPQIEFDEETGEVLALPESAANYPQSVIDASIVNRQEGIQKSKLNERLLAQRGVGIDRTIQLIEEGKEEQSILDLATEVTFDESGAGSLSSVYDKVPESTRKKAIQYATEQQQKGTQRELGIRSTGLTVEEKELKKNIGEGVRLINAGESKLEDYEGTPEYWAIAEEMRYQDVSERLTPRKIGKFNVLWDEKERKPLSFNSDTDLQAYVNTYPEEQQAEVLRKVQEAKLLPDPKNYEVTVGLGDKKQKFRLDEDQLAVYDQFNANLIKNINPKGWNNTLSKNDKEEFRANIISVINRLGAEVAQGAIDTLRNNDTPIQRANFDKRFGRHAAFILLGPYIPPKE